MTHRNHLNLEHSSTMVMKSVVLLALHLPISTAHSTIGRNFSRSSTRIMSLQAKEYYRQDGVKITHDPYAEGKTLF